MAQETRTTILEAGTRVILREGAGNLTLEAVAKEAGISKGGLLYHFPSKEALVTGLVERYEALFMEDLERTGELGTGRPGASLRAYVKATFEPEAASHDLAAGLLAAVLLNPELLEPFWERAESLHVALEEGVPDPARATVVRLAADGLWLGELLGFGTPRGEAREALKETLLELLETPS